MRNSGALRRLTEMGIDTYELRGRAAATGGSADAEIGVRDTRSGPKTRRPAITFLLESGAAAAILVDLHRALRMAGFDAVEGRGDVDACAPAVVFGEVAAGVESANGILRAGPVARLRGDAAGKRALWRKLLALMCFASGTQPPVSRIAD